MAAVFSYSNGINVQYHIGIFTYKKMGCLTAGTAVGLTIFGMGVLSYLQVINLSQTACLASLGIGGAILTIEGAYALEQYRKYAKIKNCFEAFLEFEEEENSQNIDWDCAQQTEGYDYWNYTFKGKKINAILESKKGKQTFHIFAHKLDFLKFKDALIEKDYNYHEYNSMKRRIAIRHPNS